MDEQQKGPGGPGPEQQEEETNKNAHGNDAASDDGRQAREIAAAIRKRFPKPLRDQRAWALWRLEVWNNTDPPDHRKMPYYASGRRREGANGSPEDRKQLVTCEEALRAWLAAPEDYSGIGRAALEESGFLGVDIDDGWDAEANDWKPLVKTLLASGTYAERSPSGEGLHLFFKCSTWTEGNRKNHNIGGIGIGIEFFYSCYYLTCTGDVLEGNGALKELSPEYKALLVAHLNNGDQVEGGRGNGKGADYAANGRNCAIFVLGKQLGDLGVDAEGIKERLLEHNEQSDDPLPRAEVETTARSASKKLKPRIALSDFGNAERLLLRHGHELRYCRDYHGAGVWLCLEDEEGWKVDDAGIVNRLAVETVRAIATDEIIGMSNAKAVKAYRDHARKSEDASKIEAMVRLTRDGRGIRVGVNELDANDLLLGTQGGKTIKLDTGEALALRGEHLITRRCGATFDAGSECPEWMKFIDAAFDHTVLDFLQQAVGYTLTGKTTEELVFLLVGEDDGGAHDVFLDILRALLGTYAHPLHPLVVLKKVRGGSERGVLSALAPMQGARLITVTGFPNACHFDSSVLRMLRGRGDVFTKHVRGLPYSYKMQAKLWCGFTYKPQLQEDDDDLWKSICLIPLKQAQPNCDWRLKSQTLLRELPGILRWAVKGAVEWLKHKDLRAPPAVVAKATRHYWDENAVVRLFVEQRCVVKKGIHQTGGALFNAFQEWRRENAFDFEMNATVFGTQLTKLGQKMGFHKDPTSRVRTYHGIDIASRMIQRNKDGDEELVTVAESLNLNDL